MTFSFVTSYAEKDPRMQEGAEFIADDRSENIKIDDETLEDINQIRQRAKTTEEIANYLRSLSPKKLVELHKLRKDIYQNFIGVWHVVPAVTIIAGATGAMATFDPVYNSRKKIFYRNGFRSFLGVLAVGVLSYAYGVYETHPLEGLGLNDSLDTHAVSSLTHRDRVREYINSLTLEEARKVLSDIKEIKDLSSGILEEASEQKPATD